MREPKKVFRRLLFDCETSPNLALIWNPGPRISVGHEAIVKERAIICIAWKWEGEKKIYSLTWDKHQSDKKMLQEFAKVLESADEVIGHNSDRFDLTWIRTRCLKHGIRISPDFVSIDTLKAARSKFRFNSNKLDYIGKFLDAGQKIPTGFGLWKAVVMDKDADSLKKMVRYCRNDVVLLEKIYQKMSPYLPVKTNRASSPRHCPECDSSRVIISGHRISAAGTHKIQFQCRSCGKYSTVAASKLTKGK